MNVKFSPKLVTTLEYIVLFALYALLTTFQSDIVKLVPSNLVDITSAGITVIIGVLYKYFVHSKVMDIITSNAPEGLTTSTAGQ